MVLLNDGSINLIRSMPLFNLPCYLMNLLTTNVRGKSMMVILGATVCSCFAVLPSIDNCGDVITGIIVSEDVDTPNEALTKHIVNIASLSKLRLRLVS